MDKVFISAVIFCCVGMGLHPIHVSITEAEFDEERRAIEISHRIFIDDLEKEIEEESGIKSVSFSREEKSWIDTELQKYLKRHFQLSLNGKQLESRYLGYELENDAIYIFVEYLKVRKFKSVQVKNDILLNMYDDQVNLLHFKWKKETRSLRFDLKSNQGELNFNS